MSLQTELDKIRRIIKKYPARLVGKRYPIGLEILDNGMIREITSTGPDDTVHYKSLIDFEHALAHKINLLTCDVYRPAPPDVLKQFGVGRKVLTMYKGEWSGIYYLDRGPDGMFLRDEHGDYVGYPDIYTQVWIAL